MLEIVSRSLVRNSTSAGELAARLHSQARLIIVELSRMAPVLTAIPSVTRVQNHFIDEAGSALLIERFMGARGAVTRNLFSAHVIQYSSTVIINSVL